MAEEYQYNWTDNPTVSGVAKCDTDVLNDCLMHLKYDKKDGGGSSFSLFDTILKDHVLTFEESLGWALQGTYVYKEAVAGSRYGYPDFYAKCLEEYNEATTTETVNSVAVKVHSNGHKFFDIADKEAIDEFYKTYGTAWFYGIDEENERIFLPRNDYFEQATSLSSEVGKSVEAGLPNITGSYFAYGAQDVTGAFSTSDVSGAGGADGGTYNRMQIFSFDASRSSSVYGNSDVVQPNSVKKLLYICVGNTNTESAITDVVDVTTTENDTVPLGYSTYQTGIQPNTSWLKSQGQWNDGKVYTTFYNEFAQKIGQAFASGYVKESTEEYDDYDLVINQDDMAFRLPLLDGSESIIDWNNIIANFDSIGKDYVIPYNGALIYSILNDNYSNNGATQFNLTINGKIFYFEQGYTGTDYLHPTNGFLQLKKGDVINITISNGQKLDFIKYVGNGSLYFKVANAVENLELLDAGAVMEALAEKIGRQDCPAYIVETYQNGTSWYRIYSDGWCEQGGYISGITSAWIKLSFLKPFKDISYYFNRCNNSSVTNVATNWANEGWVDKATDGISCYNNLSYCTALNWVACGYIA